LWRHTFDDWLDPIDDAVCQRMRGDIDLVMVKSKFESVNKGAGSQSEPGLCAFPVARQVAVAAAVPEINGEADREPNDKPQPSIARQAEH
jgi:hypothetical protein